ncbi:MAG: nuclear transport factor 2 family protein [Desulfobacterales bacterium]|nr:nuclear transport factor 2 family protein [Desulfobacterales bacterium]
MADLKQRIEDLHDYLRNGRIMDAMREFYADDVVMIEPAYGDTVGLAANLEREQNFVNSVKEFKNFKVIALAVGDGVTIYENVMDWIDVNDQSIHVEQAVVAKWRGGRIVHERFYYNMG